MPKGAKLDILKALHLARERRRLCVDGLILIAFTTVGPLFSEHVGFDQRRIVLLMAFRSLGGLPADLTGIYVGLPFHREAAAAEEGKD